MYKLILVIIAAGISVAFVINVLNEQSHTLPEFSYFPDTCKVLDLNDTRFEVYCGQK